MSMLKVYIILVLTHWYDGHLSGIGAIQISSLLLLLTATGRTASTSSNQLYKNEVESIIASCGAMKYRLMGFQKEIDEALAIIDTIKHRGTFLLKEMK